MYGQNYFNKCMEKLNKLCKQKADNNYSDTTTKNKTQ